MGVGTTLIEVERLIVSVEVVGSTTVVAFLGRAILVAIRFTVFG